MKQLLFLCLVSIAIFSCKENGKATSTGTTSRIVYVNTDTLLNNYEYYKDVVKEFENKKFALENDLAKRSQSFQNEVAMFQRRMQAGGISEDQARNTQAALQKKEQDIMMFRENAAGNLQNDQGKKTEELLNNITTYLKNYNTNDRYDMVIGYSKGGGVLYAKENLDITAEVLKGLNDDYKKNPKAVVTDTTKK